MSRVRLIALGQPSGLSSLQKKRCEIAGKRRGELLKVLPSLKEILDATQDH